MVLQVKTEEKRTVGNMDWRIEVFLAGMLVFLSAWLFLCCVCVCVRARVRVFAFLHAILGHFGSLACLIYSCVCFRAGAARQGRLSKEMGLCVGDRLVCLCACAGCIDTRGARQGR